MSFDRHFMLFAFVLALACQGGETPAPDPRTSTLSGGHCTDYELSWGDGAGDVSFVAGGLESSARGPMAIAAPAGDSLLVLDNVGRRIVLVGADGTSRTWVDGIDRTAEDLAVGPKGDVASFSPLTRKTVVLDREGQLVGEVEIPSTLRHVANVELGLSRRVIAVTALQEHFVIGSPNVPMAAESILRSGREGAAVVSGGQGVVSLAQGGQAQLRILEQAPGERAAFVRAIAVPGGVDALQIVGVAGDIVCARATRIGQVAGAIDTERTLLCADASTGQWVHDRPLAKVGHYMPRREIAVWSDGRRLVTTQAVAKDDGLQLSRCEVAL